MKHGQTAAKILDGAIIVCMLAIIALFATTPFLAKYLTGSYVVQSFVFFYTAGALALWFLYELRKLILSVRNGNPFIRHNVLILKRLSLSLALLLADFVFITCFNPSVSKLLCIALLLLGVLCARVLAYLIERAAEYREELDLTV
ncbi:MAG: DUF2975 domain-containing protein [Christensenella sp.]|uniref:DUF2975 domain-containing protein n=1 Tax=Christensenella sp. TaxID=1935934 RepID=UPI002B1F095E|nr:DUF2975 domain-containing protein [Christensenella sp.]MEA5003163.1 DUF2975 domain-containing protein [Christensenella sp.]